MEFITSWAHANAIAVSATILIVAYFFIATEKIPKMTVALIGGSLTLLLGLLGQAQKVNGTFDPDYFINFVDFNVIFLLVSMMIIVSIATRSGMFNWVANEMLKKTKGHPKIILCCLAIFTAIASAFLDNVTTVILIMPVTFAIAKELDINPIPFLITEILASNIGGTATLIGDPPNIIIGSAAGFTFMDFINELTIIVLITMLVVILIMVFWFRKLLHATEENMAKVAKMDNSNTITNKALMIRSLLVLLLVIIGFVTHDITHIQTCVCAMAGASILLLFEKPHEILHDVEWNTIFFFIGLFIIIGGFEAAGGIELMAKWLLDITHGSQAIASMVILWGSGILSGIIDNIPYTATMAPMIAEITSTQGMDFAYPLWWALSLGACLGGNMTIIGAAANVIVSESSAAAGHPIKFMEYLKYGVVATFTSLALSTAYVWLKYLV
ncbi:ArsB/NhaD family transporter [bacterium]|nr:ArsB/NhaD family transporter [bacterium]